MDSLRLLFLTDDPNLAEPIIGQIRLCGRVVRALQGEHPEQLAQRLDDQRFDALAAIPTSTLAIDPVALIEQLARHGRRMPVVLVAELDDARQLALQEQGIRFFAPSTSPRLAALRLIHAAEYSQMLVRVRQLEQSINETEERNRLLLENSRDPIAYIHEGMHIYANRSWRERFGILDAEEVLSLTLLDLVEPSEAAQLKQLLRRHSQDSSAGAMPEGDNAREEFGFRGQDGGRFRAELHLTPASMHGEACHQVVLRDRDAQGSVVEVDPKRTDTLTGLANRRHFLEQISQSIAESAGIEQTFVLFELAIDQFDALRMQLGVALADALLVDCADRIRAALGGDCIIARLSGEHFGILRNRIRRSEGEQLLAKLHAATSDVVADLVEASPHYAVSIAATLGDEYADSADTLLRQTGAELAVIRQNGGNRFRFFTPNVRELRGTHADAYWKQEIRDALEEDRLHLVYQPIIRLNGDVVPCYNVFVRLTDNQGKVHDAGSFMESAERLDLARDIDRWVFVHAVRKLRELLGPRPETRFFVKLSTGSLGDTGVSRWMEEDLQSLDVPARNIVIELRESSILSHIKPAMEISRKLTAMQSALCLVEFGNGLDPRKMLSLLKPRYVKVDPAQIRRLTEDESDLTKLVADAHALGAAFILPNIEEPEMMARAYAQGIDFVQGHFLQSPRPEPDFAFDAI